MLLMPNKKKIATIILGGLKKQPDYIQRLGEESETGSFKVPEDEDKSMGLEAAMDELLSAIEAKDSKAMAQAFRDACSLAEDGESEAEDVEG